MKTENSKLAKEKKLSFDGFKQRMETYDIYFNDSENSNNKGFEMSYDYCFDYIRSNNGTNNSYFKDYKAGTVSIVCNETGETVYETNVF